MCIHTQTHKYIYIVFLDSTAEIIKLNVVSIEFVCAEGGFNTDIQYSAVEVTEILSVDSFLDFK